jgi:hypothetical protein
MNDFFLFEPWLMQMILPSLPLHLEVDAVC